MPCLGQRVCGKQGASLGLRPGIALHRAGEGEQDRGTGAGHLLKAERSPFCLGWGSPGVSHRCELCSSRAQARSSGIST